jgi:hypothetical protein
MATIGFAANLAANPGGANLLFLSVSLQPATATFRAYRAAYLGRAYRASMYAIRKLCRNVALGVRIYLRTYLRGNRSETSGRAGPFPLPPMPSRQSDRFETARKSAN